MKRWDNRQKSSVSLADVKLHCQLILDVYEGPVSPDKIEARKDFVTFRNGFIRTAQKRLDKLTSHVFKFRRGRQELEIEGGNFRWV